MVSPTTSPQPRSAPRWAQFPCITASLPPVVRKATRWRPSIFFETGPLLKSELAPNRYHEAGYSGNRSADGAWLVDDPAGIAVLHSLRRKSGAAPLAQIGREQVSTRLVPVRHEGQVYPRQCRLHVVVQVPIVIEPDEVEQMKGLQVHRAFLDVAHGAVVVRVLHRGPGESEAEHYRKVGEKGDLPEIDHRGMQQDRDQCLDPDQAAILRIERLQKCLGGPIEARVAGRYDRGFEYHHEIRRANQHPEHSRQGSIELQVFPEAVIALEIQIEGFIVRAIADVVADVSLSNQDRKSTRLNSSHGYISYAVFCLKKKKKKGYLRAVHTQNLYRLHNHGICTSD